MTTTQPVHRNPGFLASANAERIKFFTPKTAPLTTAVLCLMILLSALMSSLALVAPSGNPNPTASPITNVTPLRFVDSVVWMAIVYAVVSVLFATNEYTSRQIRTSFLAVPERVPVLLAKACIIGVIGLLGGTLATFIAMLIPLAVLAGSDISYNFTLTNASMLAVSAGLFLALIGIVSLAIGILIRNVIVAIVIPVLLFSILPSVLESIGSTVATTIVGFLPSVAGRVILTTFPNPAGLDASGGMAVLGAWAVLLLIAAGIVLKSRDA